MTKESNILELIWGNGGQIPLSLLRTRYVQVYGEDIGVPEHLSLREWISSFNGVRTTKSKGDYVALAVSTNMAALTNSTQQPPLLSNLMLNTISTTAQAFSSDQEQKILRLIRKSASGEVSLSDLKFLYKKEFDQNLDCPTKFGPTGRRGCLREWVVALSSIGTRKLIDRNDTVAFELAPGLQAQKSNDSHNLHTGFYPVADAGASANGFSLDQEQKILRLIRKSASGEVSLSDLKFLYKKEFGQHLDCPGGRRCLRDWVAALSSIGTRWLIDRNDTVAFQLAVAPGLQHQWSNNSHNLQTALNATVGNEKTPKSENPHIGHQMPTNDTESVDSAFFSANGDPMIIEPEVDCGAIVEKLMSYAGGQFRQTIVHQDSASLLNILPMYWTTFLKTCLEKVSDISLDLGRRPYCWHGLERRYLCPEDTNHIVEDRDLREIVSNLQDFGDDNRAGIDGQLHRISAIRNNKNGIIGLSIRVGR